MDLFNNNFGKAASSGGRGLIHYKHRGSDTIPDGLKSQWLCDLENQAKEVQLCECYIKLKGIVIHQREVWSLPLFSNSLKITTKIIARFNSLGVNEQRSKPVPTLLGIYR